VEFCFFAEATRCDEPLERERAAMTPKISRGRPAFAQTQRQEILELLRTAGPVGVSRAEFIFERHITQCGARVDELKREGYQIVSELRDSEKYVRYILLGEPLELQNLREHSQNANDWFAESTGHERPHETTVCGPLFRRIEETRS
jgi:hypothetical protein